MFFKNCDSIIFGHNIFLVKSEIGPCSSGSSVRGVAFNGIRYDGPTSTSGFVKLGHETNVVFKVIDLPENFNTITLINSTFQNIYRNQSALIILKKEVAKEQFILKKK